MRRWGDGSCSPVGGVLRVEDELRGREQFPAGMERAGCCRALLRVKCLPDAKPCEGEFPGSYGGAEPVGAGAFLLLDRLPGFTLAAARRCVLAAVGGRRGCCCHVLSEMMVTSRCDDMPKGRESGMPEAEMWQGFFDPAHILDRLDCSHPGNVVEFGCGYGLFTSEAARRSSGIVYALDIEPEMIAATLTAAGNAGVANVQPMQRDFVVHGTGLPTGSCDYAMVFNLLHIEDPVALLREAFRVLMPAGRLGVIHWNVDPATPRGPSVELRPTPEQCRLWAEEAEFGFVRHEPGIARWHWGLLMKRS
jgi:SAM-dependent methyltransferase